MIDCRNTVKCILLVLLPITVLADGGDRESQTIPPEQTLKVAVVSPHCVFGNVGANLKHFTKLAEQAAAKHARLICFPELALVSYSTHKDVLKSAEVIPGPTTKKLEAVAKRLGVYISVGMAERDGDRYHIAQVLVGPAGYLGKYRKNHPTGSEQTCGFAPGRSFPTWDVDGFRLGILICFDGRHQDTLEAMKKAQVDVIHHPHGNTIGSLGREAEEWTRSKMVYFVPRAVKSRAYMIVNNSAEDTKQPHNTLQYASGALVIDPLGQVVDRTTQRDRNEKMIVATLRKPKSLIPPGELTRLRYGDSIFNDRFAQAGDSSTAARLTSNWKGEWDGGGKHCGELHCVVRHLSGDRWEATFTGYCDRRFAYEVKMKGKAAKDTITFAGEAKLGGNDGLYKWTGETRGKQFVGRYTSEKGKKGTFKMSWVKKLPELIDSASQGEKK
jgi:predicted amidohydrolase